MCEIRSGTTPAAARRGIAWPFLEKQRSLAVLINNTLVGNEESVSVAWCQITRYQSSPLCWKKFRWGGGNFWRETWKHHFQNYIICSWWKTVAAAAAAAAAAADDDDDDDDDDDEDNLFNILSRLTKEKTAKLCITGHLWGESTSNPS